MKLQQKKIVSKALPTISLNDFRKKLFRFLKEFGVFKAYINAMKYEYISYPHPPLYKEKYFSINIWLYHAVTAGDRYIFPQDVFWKEYHSLWLEWAYENYNIGHKTIIT